MEDLFDLTVKRQELNDKLDEIKLQIHDIDKKIELSKKEHADEHFEQIKPLLKELEELGYFTKYQYNGNYQYNVNYYSLEKL